LRRVFVGDYITRTQRQDKKAKHYNHIMCLRIDRPNLENKVIVGAVPGQKDD